MGALVVEVEAKQFPISEGEKFRQLLFSPLYHHFQLQSERLGELFLDLFDALNPPVASVCRWDHWLLCYKPKQKIAGYKDCAQIRLNLHQLVKHQQPGIRT